MPYIQFTNISKAKEAFGLTTKEGGSFIPPTQPIESQYRLRINSQANKQSRLKTTRYGFSTF